MKSDQTETPWPGLCWEEGSDTPGFFREISKGLEHDKLAVSWIGREHIFDHRHHGEYYKYSIIGYAQEGFSELVLPGEVIPIPPGSCFWIRAMSPGYRTSLPGHISVHDEVMLYGNEVDEIFERIGSPAGALRQSRPDLIGPLVREMMNDMRYATDWLDESCVLFARLLAIRIASAARANSRSSGHAYSVFSCCRNSIITNYSTLRNLAEVAGEHSISIEYMCRLFDRYGEDSPYKLLIKQRIQRAARLLDSTNLPVKDIAASVGYPDASQFCRLFRMHYGQSPGEFGNRRIRLT